MFSLGYKPNQGRSAHYTPLPDIGGWKFESDFMGDQFRYVNPAYAECISWIRRKGWTAEGWRLISEWRILLASGNYDRGSNGKVRQFKTPERAIKALEADFGNE